MSDLIIPRRNLLHAGLLGLGAGLVGIRSVEAVEPPKSGGVRFVHLTDSHVQPERRAGEGWIACLKSLQKLSPSPQFILTGGDHVFDTCNQTPQRSRLVWDLYSKIWKDETNLPGHAVLGNHDIAGWGADRKYPASEPGYGKALAIESLKMPARYYSFTAGGWKFIMLDSFTATDPGFVSLLDEEQLAWLKAELKAADPAVPIAIVSHVPILSIGIFFFEPKMGEKTTNLSNALIHRDAADLFKVMEKHDNVKLILSGHLHLIDRCEYKGKTFICDGAVSGAWWKGKHQGFSEGYGVFDIYPDGTFDHQYVDFGWKAEA